MSAGPPTPPTVEVAEPAPRTEPISPEPARSLTPTLRDPPPEIVHAPPAGRPRTWRDRISRRATWLATSVYLVVACWTLAHLWRDPGNRVMSVNPGDQTQFEWMLAHAVRLFTHPSNPLLSDRVNVPVGLNLMANTNVLGLTIPLVPVTLLFGPDVGFAVMTTLALAATATAWYYVLSRHLVRSKLAALAGGLLAGFGPASIAHASGQPDLVAFFLIPFLLLATLRLGQRPVRNGIVLGLLVVWQAFINEEVLLYVGLAGAILVLLYAAFDRSARVRWRPYLGGLVIAGTVAVALLAYPLFTQFSGPGHYRGLPFVPGTFSDDVLSYVGYGRSSLAADPRFTARISLAVNEDNAGVGWPLLLVGTVLAIRLWRRSVLVRAMSITTIVAMLLSFGPHIRFNGHQTRIPGPYLLLTHLPLFDLAVPGRFAILVTPALAVLIAMGWDRIGEVLPGRVRTEPARVLAVSAICLAVVAVLPLPPHAITRPPVPDFISSGRWREYVPPDRTLVSVPLASYRTPEEIRWQAETMLAFRIPRGYFLGPTSATDPQALFGAPPRPTSTKLYQISLLPLVPKPYVGGDTPTGFWGKNKGGHPDPTVVTPTDQAQALADLRYWRAAALVLAPGKNDDLLRTAVTRLTGVRPALVDGVWLWDVRAIVG